jgi:hypothetical protein
MLGNAAYLAAAQLIGISNSITCTSLLLLLLEILAIVMPCVEASYEASC